MASVPQVAWATSFDSIPDDCLHVVCSYLDAASLVQLSGTNRYMHEVALAPRLWEALLQKDFALSQGGSWRRLRNMFERSVRSLNARLPIVGDAAATQPGIAVSNPLLASTGAASQAGGRANSALRTYIERYREHRAQVRLTQQRRARDLKVQVAAATGARLRQVLDIVQYAIGLPLPCLCLCLFPVTLLLKLGGSYPDMSWELMFLPVFAAFGTLLLCCCVGATAHLVSRRQPDTSPWYGQYVGETHNWWGLARFMVAWNRTSRMNCFKRPMSIVFSVLMVTLPLLVQPLLVIGKLNGSVTGSWAQVFAPLWAAAALWCCAPCCAAAALSSPDDATRVLWPWAASLMFLLMPFVAILGMIASRLDGNDGLKLVFIFIPVYVLQFMCFIVGATFCCLGCFDSVRSDRPIDAAIGLIVCGILGTSLAAVINSAVGEMRTGEIPVSSLLGPLIGAGGFAFIGCVAISFALWRSARLRNFRGLYRNRCCFSINQREPSGTIADGAL